jgi:hypothetical protein
MLPQPERTAASDAAMKRDLMRMKNNAPPTGWPDSSLVFAAIHAGISFACQAGRAYMRHTLQP